MNLKNEVLTTLQYGFDNGEINGFQAMTGFLQVFGYRDPTVHSGWNIAVCSCS